MDKGGRSETITQHRGLSSFVFVVVVVKRME